MISVTEEISLLTKQENQLHTSLDNLRGQRSKVQEYKQVEKELSVVLRKSQNLQAWAVFEIGMPVYRLNSSRLGIVKELKITPGGMGEVWVSWDGLLQIPEQPNLLQIDGAALAKIVAVGDRIIIIDGHEKAGKTFTVERLLARGAVETTDESIFEREEWQKVEKSSQKFAQEESKSNKYLIQKASSSQEPPMVTQSTEELGSKPSGTTITVNTTATQIDTQIEELTEDEEKERHRLELKVERAFYESGTALREIRERRLYRVTHPSDFIGYCRDRFGKTKQAVNYLISAAEVFENLTTTTISCRVLPTSETQVRDIAGFSPQKQVEIWNEAIESYGGKVAPRRVVKDIVERLKEKPLVKASDFCNIGDAFILTRLEGAERKYNGCWAIASELREFTIAVDIYDTTLAVKPENLDPVDLPDICRQLPQTLKRIRKLRNAGILDRCAYTVLESLGRQTYLTDVEEVMLQCLENHYKIN
jgi:hypothetical protein